MDRPRSLMPIKNSPENTTKANSKTHKLNKATPWVLVLILIIQVIMLYLLVNPLNLSNQLRTIKVINEVGEKVAVPPTEIPVIAVIGDNKSLPDINTIKKDNEINASVYKDAQNGDFVLAYTTKMIIYRLENNEIIYEGDSPQNLLNSSQKAIINSVIAKAKETLVIESSSTETPQILLIKDIDLLKKSNSRFYANAQNDDVLAYFASTSKVVIFRPSTSEIIQVGNYSTSIN